VVRLEEALRIAVRDDVDAAIFDINLHGELV
jgi:hypothetical protein